MWTVLPLVDFGWAISYFNPLGWAILSWKAFWRDVGLYFFTSHWAPSWRGLFLGCNVFFSMSVLFCSVETDGVELSDNEEAEDIDADANNSEVIEDDDDDELSEWSLESATIDGSLG
ncbi:hypothetical protein L2E82_22738 [Cichorium intybus]|uniref:Uncharacterized protein n=1 Tax=Cichorium intybus TaxID=13427 RepID=A0ACB9DZJ7_CICIN|nr:hypothetical protein L2E82_22738 [Cichorium intybus]